MGAASDLYRDILAAGLPRLVTWERFSASLERALLAAEALWPEAAHGRAVHAETFREQYMALPSPRQGADSSPFDQVNSNAVIHFLPVAHVSRHLRHCLCVMVSTTSSKAACRESAFAGLFSARRTKSGCADGCATQRMETWKCWRPEAEEQIRNCMQPCTKVREDPGWTPSNTN